MTATRYCKLPVEIDAFRAITTDRTPTAIHIDGQEFHSDRAYTDAAGACWTYVGKSDGAYLWRRDGDTAAWNLATVIQQFGPLADPTA